VSLKKPGIIFSPSNLGELYILSLLFLLKKEKINKIEIRIRKNAKLKIKKKFFFDE
tara:strand:- start:436 stop:603 length:168 start_codon:yes stop_codon:yes gene_type:complete